MRHFRAIIISAVIITAMGSAARADEPMEKMFTPFSPPYKNASGGDSMHLPQALPHFFALPPRPPSAFPLHISANHTAAPQDEDDFPKPHGGTPEAMTQEQAKQILSLYGSDE